VRHRPVDSVEGVINSSLDCLAGGSALHGIPFWVSSGGVTLILYCRCLARLVECQLASERSVDECRGDA
jgi:hypothetical protein